MKRIYVSSSLGKVHGVENNAIMGANRETGSEKNVNGLLADSRTFISVREKHSSDVDRIEVIRPASPEITGVIPVNAPKTDSEKNQIHQISEGRPASQISQWSKRFSRPLSFSGSIWLKDPEDIVPQFQIIEDDGSSNEIESHSPPYHALSRRSKKRLVYLVSLAAMFSPLSSNIYFPAMNTISEVLVDSNPGNKKKQLN